MQTRLELDSPKATYGQLSPTSSPQKTRGQLTSLIVYQQVDKRPMLTGGRVDFRHPISSQQVRYSQPRAVREFLGNGPHIGESALVVPGQMKQLSPEQFSEASIEQLGL